MILNKFDLFNRLIKIIMDKNIKDKDIIDKEYICECSNINWSEKFNKDYVHNDSKCKCCYSKFNRNEITYEDLKKCSILKEGRKHIYEPCTWY